jgi:hypothetical protein
VSAFVTSLLDDVQVPQWRRLLEASPEGSAYSDPRYLERLVTAGGGTFRLLGVRHGDELVAGLALYERSSRLGAYLTPRLLLYYTSPVLRTYATRRPSDRTGRHLKALEAIAAWLGERGYAWVELRCRGSITDVRPFLARGWRAAPGYTYTVPIHDLDALWDRMDPNAHRLIRRAESRGIRVGEDGDAAGFVALHEMTMARAHVAPYLPSQAFRTLVESLLAESLARLYLARDSAGNAVAGQLVLTGGYATTHTVCAGTAPDAMETGAAPLLRWTAFRSLSALGHRANDLTDASLNPVTRFKSQLGGDLETTMVLTSPSRARIKLGRAAEAAYLRVRGAAARAIHGAIGRRGG